MAKPKSKSNLIEYQIDGKTFFFDQRRANAEAEFNAAKEKELENFDPLGNLRKGPKANTALKISKIIAAHQTQQHGELPFIEQLMRQQFVNYRRGLQNEADYKRMLGIPEVVEWQCRGFLGYRKK